MHLSDTARNELPIVIKESYNPLINKHNQKAVRLVRPNLEQRQEIRDPFISPYLIHLSTLL
jgi:hypothetical protein